MLKSLGCVISGFKVRIRFSTPILLFAIHGPSDHRVRMCGRYVA